MTPSAELPDLAALEEAAALVHTVVPATPQYCWPLLSRRVGAELWVKHENHTPTGAFKVRGGVVYLGDLRKARPEIRGVVTATTGNHGQSIAYSASALGLAATIVVPQGNNPGKNRAMRGFGATLVEIGHDFQAAYEHAAVLAERDNLHFVRSFHPLLIRGVASYALELFRAVPALDTVYVPVGLGSGICGVIAAREALRLRTEVVGVVAENAPTYALSFAAGRPGPVGCGAAARSSCARRIPPCRVMLWAMPISPRPSMKPGNSARRSRRRPRVRGATPSRRRSMGSMKESCASPSRPVVKLAAGRCINGSRRPCSCRSASTIWSRSPAVRSIPSAARRNGGTRCHRNSPAGRPTVSATPASAPSRARSCGTPPISRQTSS